MEGEALLVGIATVAVAVAGFTAVTSTLVPPGGSWSPTMRLRQRAIVSTSFNVVFEALAPLITFAWLGDETVGDLSWRAWASPYTRPVSSSMRTRQFVRAGGNLTPSGAVLLRRRTDRHAAVLGERVRVCVAGRVLACAVHTAVRRRNQFLFARFDGAGLRLASPAGFEPATRCLEGSRSSPLSYGDELSAQLSTNKPPTGARVDRDYGEVAVRSSKVTVTGALVAAGPSTARKPTAPGT